MGGRFVPGQYGNPAGKPRGTANKVTTDVREAIRSFVETYAEKLPGWIDKIAEEDPARAADLLLKASEYVLPKLGRSELTGLDGAPLGPVVPVLNLMLIGELPEGHEPIEVQGVRVEVDGQINRPHLNRDVSVVRVE